MVIENTDTENTERYSSFGVLMMVETKGPFTPGDLGLSETKVDLSHFL